MFVLLIANSCAIHANSDKTQSSAPESKVVVRENDRRKWSTKKKAKNRRKGQNGPFRGR